METLFRLPFAVLECPNIKLKRPGWVHMPSAMTVYALVVVSYFLITGGEAAAGGAGGVSGIPVGAGCCPPPRTPCPAVAHEPRPAPSVPAALGWFWPFAARSQRRCLRFSPQELSMT